MGIRDIKIPGYLARALKLPAADSGSQQRKVLKKLLRKARFTEFGQRYKFDEILLSSNPEKLFRQNVPLYDYSKLYAEWWHKTLEGCSDVCWPGVIRYFALSSGTSEASSKYIPITKDLLKSNVLTSFRQLLTLRRYENLPTRSIGKGWLMLGGSTELEKNSTYYAGDLSGIQQKNIPFWFVGLGLYKPGKKIARVRDWSEKIEEIVENAPNWDIGFIVGVPAWLQLCMEKIIDRYKLNNIHEIWPNLGVYVHGGVAMEPYKKGFEKLLAKPMIYIETYLASEGFLAYQTRPDNGGMELVINNNIFFEFVPFDEKNFDVDGNILPEAEVLSIDDVEMSRDYAILISTNAGAWRYAIGDTVRFVNKEKNEIIITGRTKHFLSLVGEHLSVDNMNKAVSNVTAELNISIPEFTVTGIPFENSFAHHWYFATDDNIDADLLVQKIDEELKKLNDDYEVERKHALKGVKGTVLSEEAFMGFMAFKGKIGGQHKFPRVLKGKMLEDWYTYLSTIK